LREQADDDDRPGAGKAPKLTLTLAQIVENLRLPPPPLQKDCSDSDLPASSPIPSVLSPLSSFSDPTPPPERVKLRKIARSKSDWPHPRMRGTWLTVGEHDAHFQDTPFWTTGDDPVYQELDEKDDTETPLISPRQKFEIMTILKASELKKYPRPLKIARRSGRGSKWEVTV
jgi:hypothetical protein